MHRRIANLATKEMIQLSRNWMLLIFIILGPTMELVLLARATAKAPHMPAVVVDQDHSQVSRQIVVAVDNTEELDVVAYLDSQGEADDWLKRNRAVMAVVLPAGLEADLGSARRKCNSLLMEQQHDGGNGVERSGRRDQCLDASWDGDVFPEWANDDLRTDVRYNPTLDADRFTITAQLGLSSTRSRWWWPWQDLRTSENWAR